MAPRLWPVSRATQTPASNFELSRLISQKTRSREEGIISWKGTPQFLRMFCFTLWGGKGLG